MTNLAGIQPLLDLNFVVPRKLVGHFDQIQVIGHRNRQPGRKKTLQLGPGNRRSFQIHLGFFQLGERVVH